MIEKKMSSEVLDQFRSTVSQSDWNQVIPVEYHKLFLLWQELKQDLENESAQHEEQINLQELADPSAQHDEQIHLQELADSSAQHDEQINLQELVDPSAQHNQLSEQTTSSVVEILQEDVTIINSKAVQLFSNVDCDLNLSYSQIFDSNVINLLQDEPNKVSENVQRVIIDGNQNIVPASSIIPKKAKYIAPQKGVKFFTPNQVLQLQRKSDQVQTMLPSTSKCNIPSPFKEAFFFPDKKNHPQRRGNPKRKYHLLCRLQLGKNTTKAKRSKRN